MTRARWAVFAYHTFGAHALQALLERDEEIVAVVTHGDDPAEGDWFESVADLASAYRLPVLMPSTPNLPVVVEMLRTLAPDVILSVWYRRLLGPELLRIPAIAALNLHGSLLPAYRGRAPVNWVLVNGETRTGVTLHHMVVEADAGDIVAQQPIDIAADDTASTLYRRIVKVGVDLLTETYPAVIAGTAPRTPQDASRATTFGRRRPEDGRVEWRWPTRRIVDMVRAVTHPYPGAFVGDGAHRLRLWSASPLSIASAGAALPGTVLTIRPSEGLVVATGDGAVLLRSVQSPGVPEEPADLWALRRGLFPGTPMVEAA